MRSARLLALAAIALLGGASGEGPPTTDAVAAPTASPSATPAAISAEAASPPPPEDPAFTRDVLTDARDVRVCLPIEGGAVLAGTGGGLLLVRADGTALPPWTALDGLPETRVHALLQDGERLFIGTEGGLAEAKITGERLSITRAIAGKPVRAIAMHSGALFAATWGGGVVKLDVSDAEARDLVPVDRAGHVHPEERFTSLAVHEGALVAGSSSGVYRIGDRSIARISRTAGTIWALASIGDRLWAGGTGGLDSIARGGSRREHGADVRALAASGGELLAGSFGEGALALGDGRFTEIADLRGRAAFVQAAGVRGEVRCVGTQEGLFVQRGAAARWEEARIPWLPSNDVAALARDGDRVRIGTFDRGLAVLDGRRARPVRDPAIDAKINAITIDRERRAWVATARGLVRIDLDTGSLRIARFGEADGLPSNDVHTVAALASGGVLVGTGRGAAVVRDGLVVPLTEKRGIAPGNVWSVAEGPDGLLLLGTGRGLLIGTLESRGVQDRGAPEPADPTEARPWIQISMASGDLRDDWVTALAVDGRTIYVGTYNAGVTALARDREGQIEATHLDGGYVNMNALLVDGKVLYAGTMNGLLTRRIGSDGPWKTASRASLGKDVTALAAMGDRLWVASRRGMSSFDPRRPLSR